MKAAGMIIRMAGKTWRLRLSGIAALCGALAACGGGDGSDASAVGDGAAAAAAHGGSDTGATAGSAAVAKAVTPLPITLPVTADPLIDNLASIPADAPTRGMWSTTQPWPMVAIHMALLPNGRVLTYGTPAGDGNTQDGRTIDVWDPSLGLAGGSHLTTFDANRLNSFCGTGTLLADGRLMMTGGNNPLQSRMYSAANGSTVTDSFQLADQRWYATMIRLPDGRNLMVGGMDPYSEGMENNPVAAINAGTVSMTPELYTVGAGWRSLFGAQSRDAFGPDYLRASYPRAWVAPDGRVFGISAETMWYLDADGNGGNGALQVIGRFKTAPSNSTRPNVGATSTAVMFAPGRILQVGGNGGFNGDGRPASRLATVVDINGASPVLTETSPMTFARRMANSVVLPDGKVLVTGGTQLGNNGGSDAVFEAELWNPVTGNWTVGARAAQVRVYHSSTLLLPNGAVLSAGGGAPGPVNNLNAEIYYPPYLFRTVSGSARLAPRPTMTAISASRFAPGDTLAVDMADGSAIGRLVLIANGIVTHAFNNGQRLHELSFTQDGGRLTATLPTSVNLLPPGYYQLFAVDAAGVPSRATTVAIGVNAPQRQGLVRNGGFEESPRAPVNGFTNFANGTSLGGWTVGSGSVDVQDNGHQSAGAGGAGGLQHVDLNGSAFGSITQTISGLKPGTRYQLTVRYAVHPQAASASASVTIADLNTTLTATNRGNVQWNRATWTFTASAAAHALRLAGTGGAANLGVLVDDVAIAAELPRLQPLLLRSVAIPAAAVAVDQAGLAVLRALALEPQGAALVGARYTARNGLADSACVSFEASDTPGRWLRHANYRLQLAADDGSALLRNDATFCPEPGLAGVGTTLRSKNLPGYVLRQRDGQIWLDAEARDAAFAADASFEPQAAPEPVALPVIGPVEAPPAMAGNGITWRPQLDRAGLQFSWSFGDGSADTPFAVASTASHTYAAPGMYLVTLTVRTTEGATANHSFVQAVYGTPTVGTPRASSAMLIEPRTSGAERIWVVNPDNDSVSVFDSATRTRLKEIATGAAPRTLARAGDGTIWVVNRDAASLSVIDPNALTVSRTVALPPASQPFGIVFAADGTTAYLTLQAQGRVARLISASGVLQASVAVGDHPRHLSLSADGSLLLVPRFITPPQPGEGTATVTTTRPGGSPAGGEVIALTPATMSLRPTIVLSHSDRTDNEIQGAGVPNYLGAAVISPDGRQAWVPSKQDNVRRGMLRNGRALDFQNTVRAVSSRIDLASLTEDPARRIDHDNASVASAAVFDRTGAYLFVALETARQVAVVNAASGGELFRIETGLAPQAVVPSTDNGRLYVHNFMDRSLSIVDITPLTRNGEFRATTVGTVGSVGTEKLAAAVLRGKQLFYDARDPRLARDSYMSCASCHNDGGHDGRTWDLTGFGEGLRNTIDLRGRAGMGQGFLHWTANFDEVQDFEGQIRALAGGTGLLSDAALAIGTRSQPLGDRKAGLSTDLDALAAYVGSLSAFPANPNRNADNTLTASAVAGRSVFQAQCASCHAGTAMTASGDASAMKDVGTIKPASGKRLGAALTALDVPTLKDVWSTAPYLHDGSAATVADAVAAHRRGGAPMFTLSAADNANLLAYLMQGGDDSPVAPPPGPPADAIACGWEGGTCSIPAGAIATVYYGAEGRFASKTGVTAPIGCNNTVFGDPNVGVYKACSYRVTGGNAPPPDVPPAGALSCAVEGGSCVLPAGVTATVYYGAGQSYAKQSGVTGTLVCGNVVFGDPNYGVFKSCSYVVTSGNAPTQDVPPAAAVLCAVETGTCSLPAGVTATVWYGAGTSFAKRTAQTGAVGCSNGVFGDPYIGFPKACYYLQ